MSTNDRNDRYDRNDRNALSQPANSTSLQDLYSSGYIDQQTRKEAVKLLCPPKIMWQVWADRMLILFSTALILAGVIFFFAYNWSKMSPLVKLGLIEFAMISSVVVALIKGTNQLVGKLFLLSASVFLGVLLAVYGQIYQTGADAYQLFVGWALLIAGWVLVSKFAGLWLMWLLLINTAIILYTQQTFSRKTDELAIVLTLVNILFLSAREYGLYKSYSWLSGKWLRWVVLGTVLFFLTCYVISQIIEKFNDTIWAVFPPILLVLINLTVSYFCRYHSKDLFSLTLVALSACAVVSSVIGKIMFKITNDSFVVTLLLGLIILALVSIAAFILREVDKNIQKEGSYGN